MDVLTEPVSVVFQEIAKIKLKLLIERENNYNIYVLFYHWYELNRTDERPVHNM